MTCPLRTASKAALATSSARSQARSGHAVSSMPARSWNSVRVRPGLTTVAVTPVPRSSETSPSVNVRTQALWAA